MLDRSSDQEFKWSRGIHVRMTRLSGLFAYMDCRVVPVSEDKRFTVIDRIVLNPTFPHHLPLLLSPGPGYRIEFRPFLPRRHYFLIESWLRGHGRWVKPRWIEDSSNGQNFLSLRDFIDRDYLIRLKSEDERYNSI